MQRSQHQGVIKKWLTFFKGIWYIGSQSTQQPHPIGYVQQSLSNIRDRQQCWQFWNINMYWLPYKVSAKLSHVYHNLIYSELKDSTDPYSDAVYQLCMVCVAWTKVQ